MSVNTSSNDAWACELKVSPEQLYDSSYVTFTVVLSHQDIGKFDHEEHASIYESFDYEYYLGGLEVGRDSVGFLNLDRLPPSIRDGAHQASVRITPRSPRTAPNISGRKLRPPPSYLSAIVQIGK